MPPPSGFSRRDNPSQGGRTGLVILLVALGVVGLSCLGCGVCGGVGWFLLQPKKPAPGEPTDIAGLVGYWPLNEGQGTAVADKTGKNPAGKLVGGSWGDGVRGKAVQLNGNPDYVDLGEAAKLDVGRGQPFTVSLWFSTRGSDGTILMFRNAKSGSPIIGIQVDSGNIHAIVRADGPEFGEARAGSRFIGDGAPRGRFVADGAWHHVALSRDNSGNIVLYLDGAQVDRGSGTNSQGPITTNLRALGSERYLAAQQIGFNPQVHYFTGAVAELAFYDRQLSVDEIKRLAGKR